MNKIKKGDYVIGTKYSDGDPMDQFAIGLFSGMTWHGRFNIVDNDGNLFRGNGFRRVKKISGKVGRELVKQIPFIESSGKSVWHFVQVFFRGGHGFLLGSDPGSCCRLNFPSLNKKPPTS